MASVDDDLRELIAVRDRRRRDGPRLRAVGERRARVGAHRQAGQASGATNAIRELGGVLGVAVLATVFTGSGGYAPPAAFVNGLVPASGSAPPCSRPAP